MVIITNVNDLFERTSGGYSFDRYGEARWRACIRMLLRRGLNDRQVEAVMLSKWTRWAADNAIVASKPNSRDLERWMDKLPKLSDQIRVLVVETFGDTGDGR